MKLSDKINYWVYRKNYIYSPWLKHKKPIDISLELSSFCNQACQYCFHADQKTLPFKKGHMPLDFAKRMIEQAAWLGANSIKFNYRGESTIHPNYLEILEYAQKFAHGSVFIDRITNSNFNFQTNRDDIFLALCTLTKVKVSFDSFRKEIIERVRKGTNYERAIANIDKFYWHPMRTNTKLVVQAVRTKENADEDLRHEIKTRWPDAIVSIRDMVAGRVDSDLSNLEIKKRDSTERQACRQAFARMIIHHDGRVSPCCPSISNDLLIGDANQNNLKEIWNGLKARQLRNELKDGSAFLVDPCKSCSSFETFKGYKPPKDS